jgi:hypothetical protein
MRSRATHSVRAGPDIAIDRNASLSSVV